MTPEYLEYRCCMCPNRDTSNTICPAGGPQNKTETTCRFVKEYIAPSGWKYKVMAGIGGDTFKARYNKIGKSSWKGMTQLPWRDSFDAAQADLNRIAKERGWSEA